jgi:tRNA/tmRNA/rRNA uracil-C5-methylase (TrmA/RlmC/RlmD family)
MYEKLIFNKHTDTPIEATFKVSANSFFQTNTHGAEVLFGTAANMV